jgi:hypothetical protein
LLSFQHTRRWDFLNSLQKWNIGLLLLHHNLQAAARKQAPTVNYPPVLILNHIPHYQPHSDFQSLFVGILYNSVSMYF